MSAIDGHIKSSDFEAIPAEEDFLFPVLPMPKVSILVITLDHDPYLAQTLDSLLGQRCDFSFEILIGEDCSKDQTLAICEDYQQRFPGIVRVVSSEKNVGMHRNLARIWHRARGQYIAICEGDDYWVDPLKLAKQVAFLEARPAYTLCGAYTQKIRQEKDGSWHDAGLIGPVMLKEAYSVEDLIPEYSFHTSSVMVRKDCVRFPVWFWDMYCADRPLYLLCAEQGPAGFIPEVMSVYRLHGTGIWSPTGLLGKAEKGQKLFETLDAYFGRQHHRLIQRTLCDIIWSYMAEALGAGQLPAARRLFWMAVGYQWAARQIAPLKDWPVLLARLYLPRGYAWIKSLGLRGGRA